MTVSASVACQMLINRSVSHRPWILGSLTLDASLADPMNCIARSLVLYDGCTGIAA